MAPEYIEKPYREGDGAKLFLMQFDEGFHLRVIGPLGEVTR